MEENLKWLWYAFGAGWLIHIGYLFSLASRARRIGDQLEHLRTLLAEQESKTGGAGTRS